MTLYAFHPEFYAESGINIGIGLVGIAPTVGEVPSGRAGGGVDGVPKRNEVGRGEIGIDSIPSFEKLGE